MMITEVVLIFGEYSNDDYWSSINVSNKDKGEAFRILFSQVNFLSSIYRGIYVCKYEEFPKVNLEAG